MANGLTFRNAHCPAAACSPSRASLLTGLYPAQHGVKSFIFCDDPNYFFSATAPMRIFWQAVEKTYSSASTPLTGPELFAGGEQGGWSFFHLSIDESTGIIIGNDQGIGLLTAVQVIGDDEIERLWQIELHTSARPVTVSDREMVKAKDFDDGRDHLVVLDLMTGEEMLRVPTPATRATIIVSSANEAYFGSNEPGQPIGLFYRIYVP
jgi:hypothetical protein